MVSVVIPCYNQAVYLSETLDSVLEQTYQDWEIVLVNDGSPDNTEEVAKMYMEKDDRIRYVYKENGGLSSARNVGIHEAKGQYILPLDSDDIIKPTYMELAMQVFEKNPSYKVVYCQGMLFGKINYPWKSQKWRSYKSLLARNPFFCSAFFRKSDCLAAGGYDENMRTGFEDWEFFIRLLDEYDTVYQIPQALFYYRVKNQSMLTQATHKDVAPRIESYIYHKHEELYVRYYGGILSSLGELDWLQERRLKHKQKWYRRLYHALFR